MFKMFKWSFGFTFSIFKILFIILFPWLLMITIFYIYYFAKGYRMKKRTTSIPKKRGKLKRLLIDFPRQYVLDLYSKDPDEFNNYGIHIFAGEQGSGKTITAIYLMEKYKKIYPNLIIKTNMNYKNQNKMIDDWKDIVGSNNGIYGEIDMLDEIQNWFSSMQSANFPVDMLEEITQQRKQKKCIFGTSQVWSRVGKPIREQTTFLYEPITIFGCLTIVRKYKPIVKQDGSCDEKKLRSIFFFIQNDKLRNLYDTYEKIERLSKKGFKEETKHLRNLNNVNL